VVREHDTQDIFQIQTGPHPMTKLLIGYPNRSERPRVALELDIVFEKKSVAYFVERDLAFYLNFRPSSTAPRKNSISKTQTAQADCLRRFPFARYFQCPLASSSY
jgi:hypothetical protein